MEVIALEYINEDGEPVVQRHLPARTPEQRERQLVNLAMDAAEKQIRNGTASAQVLTHFLKIASVREEKERLKLDLENKLLEAKAEQIQSQARSEELYREAMQAFKSYSGHEDQIVED